MSAVTLPGKVLIDMAHSYKLPKVKEIKPGR
jgi:hypothetical protein